MYENNVDTMLTKNRQYIDALQDLRFLELQHSILFDLQYRPCV
jgi:hypothetical protein